MARALREAAFEAAQVKGGARLQHYRRNDDRNGATHASINGYNKVAANGDGSIDLYFGPQKPANAADSNWIQRVNGRDFLVALRLYGAGLEFYDQSWKPDDLVKVK